MPHPVGGAMGVTCATAVKRETPALKRSHAGICMAVVL